MINLATTQKYLDDLEILAKTPDALSFVDNLWNKKEIYIGGVINYESGASNGIKFFTQSIYSHTNFFDPEINISFGSENLIGVVSVDYSSSSQGKFYYVVKKLNIDYLATIFSFESIYDTYLKIGKIDDNAQDFLKKYFVAFAYAYDNSSNHGLRDVLSFNLSDIQVPEKYVEDLAGKTHEYLKKFIILGFIKYIISSYKNRYNLSGALLTSTTPWDKILCGEKKVFCSEFVADALLYAGLYPYDLNSKDPRSITPGDIMDSSVFFEKQYLKIYRVDDTKDKGKYLIDITKDLISHEKNLLIKNYIILQEEKYKYFRKLRLLMNLFNRIIIFFTNRPR